jgi:small multidrug resistance pump
MRSSCERTVEQETEVMTLTQAYVYLGIAIISEVIATTALKASDGFTQLWPSVLTVAGYAVAFYCLALTLRVIPTGVAYAIWSGVGIVLISLAGWVVFRQSLDLAAMVGMGLIVAGVVVINMFSSSVRH